MIIKQFSAQTIDDLRKYPNFQSIELHNQQTTVSKGMMAETVKYLNENSKISLEVLIRPRLGNFVYNDNEIKIMETDIFEAQALGVDRVAIGASTADGKLDIDAMKQLCGAAGGMQITLNHVFEHLSLDNQKQAIDFAANNYIDRIMIKIDEQTKNFEKHLQSLIEYNKGSVQFVLTGKDKNHLIELCQKYHINLMLLD